MPDWKKIVRERLSSPKSLCSLKEEVLAELAAHLEESYAAALSHGSTEPARSNSLCKKSTLGTF